MVTAYVGSGGKTTLIHRHAQMLRNEGKRVFVTTSTKMLIEADTILTDDAQVIIDRLNTTGYAMAGVGCGEKIAQLPKEVYLAVCRHADAVLVEADGSKGMPLKYPAAHEPVIYDNTDRIIVVCGLRGIGRPVKEVCHRLELVKECLGVADETVIREEHVIRLLRKGYLLPLREKYPGMSIDVHPVHDGSAEMMAAAKRITEAFI